MLEMGSGGAGFYLPFPQAGSLPRLAAPLMIPPQSCGTSFPILGEDCPGKDGNGEKWGRRDTGSLRNHPEELLLCWQCWDFWTAMGELWWALAGFSWHVESPCSVSLEEHRMLSGIAGQCQSPLGQTLVSCRCWKGLGQQGGSMAQEWESPA